MAKAKKQNKIEELIEALSEMETEKNISQAEILDALSYAIATAYSKNTFDDEVKSRCDIDIEKGTINLYWIRDVVEKYDLDIDWDIKIELEEARKQNKNIQVGDEFETLVPLETLPREVVQKIKGLFNQRVKETSKKLVYDRFKELEGKITTGQVEKVEDGKYVLLNLGNVAHGFMPLKETIPGETYSIGQAIKVYVKEVAMEAKKESITVSRSDARFLFKLFGSEIAEIDSGDVYIRNIARLPGVRSKIVVSSKIPGLDAAGTCIGKNGSRISKIVEQLANGQEKIDVIEYYDDPLMMVKAALSPAIVEGIGLREEKMTTQVYNPVTKQKEPKTFIGRVADVVVSNTTFTLAIGIKGQNAFLARKLSKFDKLNIVKVDDAIGKIEYRRMSEIEANYFASKNGAPVVKPTTTIEDIIGEEESKELISKPVITKPIEAKPVQPEVKVENKVEVEDTPAPKYDAKHISVVEEESKEEKPVEKTPKGPSKKSIKKEEEQKTQKALEESKKNGMAIYTEEELQALDQEIPDDNDVEEEDVDYEDYDDYYDQY